MVTGHEPEAGDSDGLRGTGPGPVEAGSTTADRGRASLRSRLAIAVGLLGLVAVALLWYRWYDDPDRRLGPAPTVAAGECGFGNPPGAVLAVDARSGALRWSRLVTPMEGDGADTPTGLALAGGTLAVFTGDGRIEALDAADGSHRWCTTGGLVSGVDDRLFTIRGEDTVELDPATGQATTVDLTVLTSLLEAAADPIAVGTESVAELRGVHQALALTATDRSSGAVRWTREVSGYEVVTTSDLVLVNDQTGGDFRFDSSYGGGVDVDDDFRVAAYALETGQPAWTLDLPSHGGVFLAGADRAAVKTWPDDTVRLIDTRSGELVWSVRHDNPGRTRLYSEQAFLSAVAPDPATDTIYLLLVSSWPHRD